MTYDRKQLQRLTLEIKDFVQYLSPTRSERDDRAKLFNDCKRIIQNHIPRCKVIPFGSYETGLLLPTSDVDLRIAFEDEGTPMNPKSMLRNLSKALVKRYGFRNVELIFAKIPVIKVDFETSTGEPIHVDISIGNSALSSDRTLRWVNEYSELKPIYILLKTILLSIRLKDDPKYEIMSARLSGMAGYTLVCLIVHYIQNAVIPKELDRTSEVYLGQFLLDFLDFYSEWDYQTQEMVMDGVPGFVDKESPATDAKLSIRDPDDASVNVARSTTTMDRIQAVFKWISEEIRANMKKDTILRALVSKDWKFGARDRYKSYAPRTLTLSAKDIGFKIVKHAKDYSASNRRWNDESKRKRPHYDEKDSTDSDNFPRKRYRGKNNGHRRYY